MSTSIGEKMMQQISSHRGGIFYDLAGHVLDQIIFLKGEPKKITSFIRKDFSNVSNFFDNTVSILEFKDCIASIDISADEMEFGVGIHGEPGRRREKIKNANELS